MESDGFADILVEFIDGVALGEDIFSDPAGTPRFAVVIDLNFD